MVVLPVILAVAGLPDLLPVLRGKDDRDAPARIVTFAAARLPAHRRDWGQPMVAELAQIRDQVDRWRFATGALRIAALPPARRPGRALAAAIAAWWSREP